jgi:hypothetical protein
MDDNWNSNLEFLRVVLDVLSEHGKTPEDVEWVGTSDGKMAMNWHEFEEWVKARMMRWYSSGSASSDVPKNFVIVGDIWWIRREESGGFEDWEFLQKPEPFR